MRRKSCFFCSMVRVVADGQLDQDQVVGVGDAEIARRMHDLGLRCSLRDDLKEIVLRYIERLDQGILNALRDGLAKFGALALRHGDANERHCGSPHLRSPSK
jgi:hypothetical protein